ncbi:MAG: thymidylate kinase [Methanomassiliicoccales archaeon]
MRWIVVDGIDGAGKNTCAHLIEDHYRSRGEEVRIITHPSDRRTGRVTRKALLGRGRIMHALAALSFLADMLISLREAKRLDGTVIFVRYLMATAYLPGRGAEMTYRLFRRLFPPPDHLLLVDVDPQVALSRITEREEEREMFETLPRLRRIRRRILHLADEEWRIVDNSCSLGDSRKQLEIILGEWDRDGIREG